MDQADDQALYFRLKEGDELAFKALFHKYYSSMCQFAYQFLKDSDQAEETVQELFVRVWEKRAALNIETSVNHYLFRAVRNHCLNQLQHQKIKQQYASTMMENAEQEIDWQPVYLEVDLMERIEKSIASMPPKRQEIFRLSREQGLKYKEIADKLHISVKTVEAQMGLALKFLREDLQDFNHSLISLLIILKKTAASSKG